MIYLDIDGVIRNLSDLIIKRLGKSDFSYSSGRIIFKIVKENPNVLVDAPVTKYMSVIQKHFEKPHFISAQLNYWIPYTEKWLKKYFKEYVAEYCAGGEEKLKFLKKTDLLIEDNPNMGKFDQIILIDYSYNQNVKNLYARIKEPEELDVLLCKLKERSNNG